MQQMVTPFANVATRYGSILPASRRDTSVFGGYCVAIRLLRMTKPYDSRLVSPQKRPVSRPWLKRQQPLVIGGAKERFATLLGRVSPNLLYRVVRRSKVR